MVIDVSQGFNPLALISSYSDDLFQIKPDEHQHELSKQSKLHLKDLMNYVLYSPDVLQEDRHLQTMYQILLNDDVLQLVLIDGLGQVKPWALEDSSDKERLQVQSELVALLEPWQLSLESWAATFKAIPNITHRPVAFIHTKAASDAYQALFVLVGARV